jgi:hypothetical protein
MLIMISPCPNHCDVEKPRQRNVSATHTPFSMHFWSSGTGIQGQGCKSAGSGTVMASQLIPSPARESSCNVCYRNGRTRKLRGSHGDYL